MANQVKIQIVATADTGAIDRVAASLKKLRDKRVKVDVDVDKSKLNRLENLSKRARVKVDLDVDDSRLRSLRNQRVKVKVDVDSSSLTALQGRLASLRNQTVTVRVRATEDRINDRARNLIRNRTANINVALNGIGAAEARLTALARNRTARIRLDLDAGAAMALNSILNALTGAGGAANNANRVAGGMSNMASSGGGLARMAPALLALAPAIGVLATGAIGAGIYGTAAALGAVTAVAGGIGAGVTAGLAAIPIAAAATSQEVKDHFSYMKNDVVDTMKNIAQPVQQPLVNMATSLGAAFHQMRPSLEAITNGTADLVNYVSSKMPEIASQVGPAMEKMFAGGVPHLKNLVNMVPDLAKSFGSLGESLGSPEVVAGAERVFGMIPKMVEGAGTGIEMAAKGFNNVMGFLDSGKMDGFTQGIGDFFNNLGNTDWSGVTSSLADAGNAFGNFMGSLDTQYMAGKLEGLTDFATDLTDFGTAAVGAFQAADEGLTGFLDKANSQLSGFFSNMTGGKNLGEMLFGDSFDPNKWLNDHAGWLGDFQEKVNADAGGGSGIEVPVTPKIQDGDLATGPFMLPPIEQPVVPKVEGEAPVTTLGPLPLPVTPQVTGPPVIPASPPLPIDIIAANPPVVPPPTIPALDVILNPPAPPAVPPVDLTANPIAAPPPPAPVPVDVVVADGQVSVPPPPPVPVTFDVTQPELNLSVPPVPISFNVTLPNITIPPVEAQATVTVTSNAGAVAAEINALSAGTSSYHTVSSNVAAVAGQISSLNGMNTSSTHTVNVVKTGDTGPGTGR